MSARVLKIFLMVAALVAPGLLAGCATAPATGRTFFTGLVTRGAEPAID